MLVRQNTKTARTWASDYVPDDPEDQENGSPNLDRPSAMASGMEGGSAWAAHLAAEELILRGARTKPVKGQTMVDYVATITHLHLANMGLEGDLAPLRFCANVRVVYVYDNRLTSLGGLDGKLQMLTHLYAQNNLVESLDDFVAPPSLQQLYLNGNAAPLITGLQEALSLTELSVASPALEPLAPDDDDPHTPRWAPVPRALLFEPMSLLRVARTLIALDVSGCGLDDDAFEQLRPLGGLERLDARNNLLRSPMRVAMMLTQLPYLMKLKLAGNPLTAGRSTKWREELIVASSDRLVEIDGKEVQQHERHFLRNLAARSASRRAASRTQSAAGPRGGGGGGGGGEAYYRQDLGAGHGLPGSRRPSHPPTGVSIDARPSHSLVWDGPLAVPPPGMRPESVPAGPGQALPSTFQNSTIFSDGGGRKHWTRHSAPPRR